MEVEEEEVQGRPHEEFGVRRGEIYRRCCTIGVSRCDDFVSWYSSFESFAVGRGVLAQQRLLQFVDACSSII